MDYSHLLKKRLFSPGPTTIPLQSQFAAVNNNPYHRSPAFNSIFLNCLDMLKNFFGTHMSPLILSSSGTGAMEAALVNLTDAGTPILMINGGKFGERWTKMAQSYSCEASIISVPWGSVLSPEDLRAHLKKNSKYKAVFFQGVETSTGVYFPVKEYAKIIREYSDALIVVDALSSILAHELKMDEWHIDCAIAASQKGFGVGAGLSFLALSERARSRLSSRPRFYFDLQKELKGQQSKGESAWTPATQLILSLQSSLQSLCSLGPEFLYAYHQQMSDSVRDAFTAMGIEFYVNKDYARSVTTLLIPKDVDGEKLKALIQKKYGMTFAGGQDHLKGKILRLAHMGFVDPFDLLSAVAAFELAMKDLGFPALLGKGTGAMMKSFPM